MKIVVPMYQPIGWLTAPFLHLYNKYWGDPNLVLLADKNYSGGRCPVAQFPDGECRDDKFSTALLWYANNLADEFFIILNLDYWLTAPVDRDAIAQAIDYMREYPDVLRIELGNNSGVNIYCPMRFSYKRVTFSECPDTRRDCFLTTALTPGLWSRGRFQELVCSGWTPWDIEIIGQQRYLNKFFQFRSLGMDPEPINYINVVRGANNDTVLVDSLTQSEIAHLIPRDKTMLVVYAK